MAKKHESKWNIEDLTHAEIYAAIRYLEPEPRSTTKGQNDATDKKQNDIAALVISVTFVILMLGLWVLFFYR